MISILVCLFFPLLFFLSSFLHIPTFFLQRKLPRPLHLHLHLHLPLPQSAKLACCSDLTASVLVTPPIGISLHHNLHLPPPFVPLSLQYEHSPLDSRPPVLGYFKLSLSLSLFALFLLPHRLCSGLLEWSLAFLATSFFSFSLNTNIDNHLGQSRS